MSAGESRRPGRERKGRGSPRTPDAAAPPGQDPDEAVAALTRRMLRKQLYVVISRGIGRPDLVRTHLLAHLEYMIALEREGVLFASGPFGAGAENEGQAGDGLTILRAAGLAQARAIAEADPFVRAAARTFELREWTVNEGSLGIRVNLSDQSLDVA